MKANRSYKIIRTAIEVFLGVVVVLFVGVFIMAKTSSSPLFVFNKTTMWVMTESMSPTIQPRTYILVEKITAEEAEVGDIIVFRSTDPRIKNQFNTHRIIEKNGDKFVTKGDNNPTDDGIYSALAENIVGRYVATLPVMTLIGRVTMTSVGFAILIVLLIIAMAACIIPDVKEAVKIKQAEAEEEKEKEKRRLFEEEMRRLKENFSDAESNERDKDV